MVSPIIEADEQRKVIKTKRKRSSNGHLILNTRRAKIPKNVFTPAIHVTKKRKKKILTGNKRKVQKRFVHIGEDKENNNERDNDLAQLRCLVAAGNETNRLRKSLPLEQNSPENSRSPSLINLRNEASSSPHRSSPENSRSPSPQRSSLENSRSPSPVNTRNVYTPAIHVTKKRRKNISTCNKRQVKKRFVHIGEDTENNDGNQRNSHLLTLSRHSTPQLSSSDTTLLQEYSQTLRLGNSGHDTPPSSFFNPTIQQSPISQRDAARNYSSLHNSKVRLLSQRNPRIDNLTSHRQNNEHCLMQCKQQRRNVINLQNDDGPLPQAVKDDDDQLLGEDFKGDTMIKLMNSIYCTKSVIEEIFVRPRSSTAVARYLMEGVFNPANLLDCTLTGRKIQNQGKEQKKKYTKSLNNTARETIKEVAKNYAIYNNLTPQDDMAYDRAMTTKLGEMKRDFEDQLRRREQIVNMLIGESVTSILCRVGM